MSFNSSSLIQHLQDLEQQIAATSGYRHSLGSALARQDFGEVLCRKLDAERHLIAMATTTGHIKAQVVPADGLGDVVESLSELVLRAVRMVLLTELDALPAVVSESCALCPEPFRSINGCLRNELHRITCQWDEYRGMQGVERAAYRAALRAAHASMRELGESSVAARALREGLARTDWPELQEVCARMLAALAIQIDIEPDTPLLLHAGPSHDAAPGSREQGDRHRVRAEPVAGSGPPKGTHAGYPTRAYRLLVHAGRALAYGFLLLALSLITPFAHLLARLRGHRDPANPGPNRAKVGPAELATTSLRRPQDVPVRHPHFALPEVEYVAVDPDFGVRLYDTVSKLLQLGPRSKLLDLRAATIRLDLFEGLAGTWKASPGTVPRLGVLLTYEGWAVLHDAAARSLAPVIDKGVAVEIFYEQQIDSVPLWFSHGYVRHDHLRTVLAWLRTQWRATASWPKVLSTTATLVHAFAPPAEIPELLMELSAIALSVGSLEAVEHAAGYSRTALAWVGNKPSTEQCRALRSLATAIMAKGEIEQGLALVEAAITMAIRISDPLEEARGLHQVGSHAFLCRHFALAEIRFRQAIIALPGAGSPRLRATLHHDLAAVLHAQSKNDEEAECHASTALELRWDKESHLAHADRALLAQIRASRPSPRS